MDLPFLSGSIFLILPYFLILRLLKLNHLRSFDETISLFY